MIILKEWYHACSFVSSWFRKDGLNFDSLLNLNGILITSVSLSFNPSKILGVLMLICVIGIIAAVLCSGNEEEHSW